MKKILKVLNPFIAIINYFRYSAHLESQRFNKNPEPYDFSKDMKYF
jgi:hypothetical protein